MIHVRQIAAMDCGRAAVQSLAECSFETVREHFPASVDRFGSAYGTIWFACQNITGRAYRILMKRKPEKMGLYLKRLRIKTPEIVLCYRPEITVEAWRDHFVGIDEREWIYDPLEVAAVAAKTVYASKYAEWLVLGVVKER
jgi:hypothetical protein